MATYDIIQLTEAQYYLYPSISDEGSRVVFSAMRGPSGMPTIWLYDKDHDDEPRQLSVFARGSDHALVCYHPQISGDGRKIVFTNQGYYTEAEKSGLYVYDIDSGTIQLKAENVIPRAPWGLELPGEPGLEKQVCRKPAISSDGRMLSFIVTQYRYSGATRDHWYPHQDILTIAEGGESPRGDDVLKIVRQNHFGNGILSQGISGDGRSLAFYAGGTVDGLQVSNLEMPPYQTETHGEHSGPTCNVYCYIVDIENPPHYNLKVVPVPDSPGQPLIVAHPQSQELQSFKVSSTIHGNPPGLSHNGSRIALNAGLVMSAANTGTYICEPFGTAPDSHTIVTFGAQPGAGPGEQTLTTGVVPAISSDGHWLAYNRREVAFPEGYGAPDAHEEDETYCPNVERDVAELCRLPVAGVPDLIETDDDSSCGSAYGAQNIRLGVARDANHVVFVSRTNKLCYATLVPD